MAERGIHWGTGSGSDSLAIFLQTPYVHFVREIMRAFPTRPIILLESRHVSVCLHWRAHSTDAMATAARDILKRHGWIQAAFIGHSYGTFVMSRIAQLHQPIVQSMVRLSTTCCCKTNQSSGSREHSGAVDCLSLLLVPSLCQTCILARPAEGKALDAQQAHSMYALMALMVYVSVAMNESVDRAACVSCSVVHRVRLLRNSSEGQLSRAGLSDLGQIAKREGVHANF